MCQLQWGHDDGVVEDVTQVGPPYELECRFNGATTKESWKARTVRRVVTATSWLQWGHDDGVVEDVTAGRSDSASLRGFNGATTMESWKTRRA